MQSFELEKDTWSDTDFDVMGWHDARIYAFAFIPEEYEYRLDIDYIFKWVIDVLFGDIHLTTSRQLSSLFSIA